MYAPTKVISIYEVKNIVSKMIWPFYEYMYASGLQKRTGKKPKDVSTVGNTKGLLVNKRTRQID